VLQIAYVARQAGQVTVQASARFPSHGRSVMARLVVVIIAGVMLAVGATFLLTGALAGVANGSPSNGSLYQYGNR
jgi:hypothetical protein